MGWVWRDDDDDDDQQHTSSRESREFGSSNAESWGPCSTRKITKSRCRTEKVEPSKFVRKCEKSQEILKDCIGKPVEVVESSTEYTEDVTEEILQRGSSKFGSSSDDGVFDFPGLRSDLEAMEKNVVDGLSRFFDAAQDVKDGFVDAFAKAQRIFDGPSAKPEASTKPNEHQQGAIHDDLSALAKDV